MEDFKSDGKENGSGKKSSAETKDNFADRTFEMVKAFAHKGKKKITDRIEEIEHEIDLEKVLHFNLSALALTGAVLSYTLENKRWLIMPAAAALLLAVDTVAGITSKVPFLKRLGLRLKDEILHERYALKVLRGDFKHADSAEVVWDAAE